MQRGGRGSYRGGPRQFGPGFPPPLMPDPPSGGGGREGRWNDNDHGRNSPSDYGRGRGRRRGPGRGNRDIPSPKRPHIQDKEDSTDKKPTESDPSPQGKDYKMEGSSSLSPSHSAPVRQPNNEDTDSALAGVPKFSHRAKLFIANVQGMKLDQFKKLFEPFGEVMDPHVNSERGFGFIRLAYRHLADKAIRDLDGKEIDGKRILVRYPESDDAIEVTNLPDSVTDELLEEAFAQFGPIEKATVAVDGRRKSLNYGVVYFKSKQGMNKALKACTEEHFYLTHALKPVIVRERSMKNEEDGYPDERVLKMRWAQKDRETPPRFAIKGTFEDMMGFKWKELYQDYNKKKAELEKELNEKKDNLMKEIEAGRGAHEKQLYFEELWSQRQSTLEMLQQIEHRLQEGNIVPPLMPLPTAPPVPLLPPKGDQSVKSGQFPPGPNRLQ